MALQEWTPALPCGRLRVLSTCRRWWVATCSMCAACERSYVILSSLKRHSNVHWRRKYPCRYCEKVFVLAEYRTNTRCGTLGAMREVEALDSQGLG